MLTFKVTTVGSSAGFILTKEAMARLKVSKGDTLYLTERPTGGYRITPYNPDFERQMKLAEISCMRTATSSGPWRSEIGAGSTPAWSMPFRPPDCEHGGLMG